MSKRIAVGGFLTECNCFGGVPLTLERFKEQEYLSGQELIGVSSGVVGGMLRTLAASGLSAVPLMFTSSCPGGPMTADCFSAIRSDVLARLDAVMPVDGVLLALHGSSVAEDADDPEGDLIRAVRALVGDKVPIIATLDLHAHVTNDMVHFADALIAWETYPHRDSFSTGERAARLMHGVLADGIQPTMAMAKVPVIISGIHGATDGDDPFADLMRQTKAYEDEEGVLSTSLFLVHPYNDVPDMGSGCLAVTNGDLDRAKEIARDVATSYWDRRFDLEPEAHTPAEAVRAGMRIDGGPVILVDAADCCGGGAAGDSVAVLKALIEIQPDAVSFVPVVDPGAASACHAAGVGATLNLTIGHHLDPRWGTPVDITGMVLRLTAGRFEYSGGIWEGKDGNMGPSAVFEIGNIQILITSLATYDWKDEQFRSVGIVPESAKFIVAKNPMNYRFAYGQIAKATYVLDTPGPTPSSIKHLEFKQLRRPFFPKDEDIPDAGMTLLV